MAKAPRIHDPQVQAASLARAFVLNIPGIGNVYLMPVQGEPTADDSIGFPTLFIRHDPANSATFLYSDFDGSGDSITPLGSTSLPAATDITIAAGVATLTGNVHTLRGAGAAADDLDTISGMADSEFAFLLCGAEAITIRDAAVGAGNIAVNGDESLVLATGDLVMAVRSGAVVRVTALSMAAGIPVGSLVGTAAVANVPAAATATLAGIGTYAMDDGVGAFDLDTIAGLADGDWAWLTISDIAHPITIRDFSVGAGNIFTRRQAPIVLAALTDMALVIRDGAMYKVSGVVIQAGQASQSVSATMDTETRAASVHYAAPIAEELVSIVADTLCADGAQIIAGQPDVPRELAIRVTIAVNHVTAGTLRIIGVGHSGEALDVLVSLITGASATFYTGKAFATVASATVAGLAGGAGAGDNIGVGVSDKLGLPACNTPTPVGWSVYKTVVDSADEAVAGVDAGSGTVEPTTAPNGVRVYDFFYTYEVTPTQAAHSHLI